MYQSESKLLYTALCPFYQSEFKRTISCEGISTDLDTVVLRFRTEEEKKAFAEKNCMKYPNSCPLAGVINKKYEKEKEKKKR